MLKLSSLIWNVLTVYRSVACWGDDIGPGFRDVKRRGDPVLVEAVASSRWRRRLACSLGAQECGALWRMVSWPLSRSCSPLDTAAHGL